MNAKRKILHTLPFTADEAQRLAEYLKSDCDLAEHLNSDQQTNASHTNESHVDVGRYVEVGNVLGPLYPQTIDRLITLLNKNPRDVLAARERRLARQTFWKLHETRSLPRCQMDAMCTYVHLCASVPQEQSQAASFIERRSKAAKAIDSTTRQLQTLSNALIDEEAMATRQYGFLDLNKELRGIVSLMAASVEAIQQIQKIRQHSFYLDRMIGHYALLIRKARSGILSPPHPKGRRATAADAEHILPLLHEAMTGSAPSQAIEVYYRENNTSRDMARFFHEETKAKLQKLIDGLNCIIPGFEERIGTEPLEDIPKTPVQVPVSPDCAEILWLADIHSAYIHSHNQGGFLDLAQALLEMLSACGPGISGTRDNSARS